MDLNVQVEGYVCKRCQKSEGGILLEEGNYYFFCGTDDCIDDDANYSKKNNILGIRKKIPATTKHNLGPRFQNASLASWLATNENKEKVLNWIRNQKNFLVHLGVPGCGKTYFSAAVLNYLWERGDEVYHANIRSIFAEIQQNFSKGENQYYTIKKYSEKKFLIIDDLGASTNSEWQKEMVLELIDSRYESELPTIITSNLNHKELYENLGGRTASRILAKENTLIEIWDISYRDRG